MSYELFKFTHFLAALVFILFLFFHCDYTLSAWDYFIVSGVLFSLSWLHRQIRIYFEHGIGHRAHISLTPNGFVRVCVPTKARWQAGQHFFVRFLTLGVHAWSIHPFTACSLPIPINDPESTQSELVFYIRPRGGFTARLARLAESKPQASIRVLLDGPYGGVDMRKIEQSQRHLVVAGGSGAGWVLPMISAFLRKQQRGYVSEKPSDASHMKVVVATRDPATAQWFEEAVREVVATETKGEVGAQAELDVEVFYTGSKEGGQKSGGQFLQDLAHPEDAQDVKQSTFKSVDMDSSSGSDSESRTMLSFKHLERRPDLPTLVTEASSLTLPDEQLGIFLCGPLSMQSDTQNAVAAEQLKIMKGARKQVYLHMEHFSWA